MAISIHEIGWRQTLLASHDMDYRRFTFICLSLHVSPTDPTCPEGARGRPSGSEVKRKAQQGTDASTKMDKMVWEFRVLMESALGGYEGSKFSITIAFV